jgi:hypothetical protein
MRAIEAGEVEVRLGGRKLPSPSFRGREGPAPKAWEGEVGFNGERS